MISAFEGVWLKEVVVDMVPCRMDREVMRPQAPQ
jgi:hypothetical protein